MNAVTAAASNNRLFLKRRYANTGIIGDPPVTPGGSRPLHRAFGLDRDLRIGIGRCATEHAHLLVARLLARDQNLGRIDLLAETRNAIGAERIGAGDDAATVLDRHGHLGVRDRRSIGVLHEAEIGRAFVFVVVIVVTETGAAGPE